jgi:pimeloyl-ACP methyl ester carboxylesterase
MQNWPKRKLKGTVQVREVEFPSLKGNPLCDPYRRDVVVYLPPGFEKKKKRLPCIVALSAFLGTSLGALNFDPTALNLVEQADTIIEQGAPSFVFVCVDGFTRFGGSQYLDSKGTGNYEKMIVHDLLLWLEGEFRIQTPIGILGRSSGGYGALRLGMRYPELFSAIACHSADMHFEFCYKLEFPHAAPIFSNYGTVKKFLQALFKKEKISSQEFSALNVAAMAACYSPNLKDPFNPHLPFDLETLETKEEVWKKWLENDPIFLIETYWKNLKKLKLVFLDCGNRDEYFLNFGARFFSKKLKKLGIRHIYEEFPDGHRGTSYRYKISLPQVAQCLHEKRRT